MTGIAIKCIFCQESTDLYLLPIYEIIENKLKLRFTQAENVHFKNTYYTNSVARILIILLLCKTPLLVAARPQARARDVVTIGYLIYNNFTTYQENSKKGKNCEKVS